jgi:hypothetical protein
LKIPLRAISIMPLEKVTPTRTPEAATIIATLNVEALEPSAELRKFTASLATPTVKSVIARMTSIITISKCKSNNLTFLIMSKK